MKYLPLLLLLALLSIIALSFRQKKGVQRHHLIIAVYDDFGASFKKTHPQTIIVTIDDGSQQKTNRAVLSTKDRAEAEDSLSSILQPYLASGWELSASQAIITAPQNDLGDNLYRYFMYKDE
jgi:hypothetical protein